MDRALSQMREAGKRGNPIFVYGPVGQGKSALIREYLGGRTCRQISFAGSQLQELPSEEEIPEEVLWFSGLPFVQNPRDQQILADYVRGMAGKRQLIFEALGPVPSYLAAVSLAGEFCVIGAQELRPDEEQIRSLLAERGVEPDERKLEEIRTFTDGNMMLLLYLQNVPGEPSEEQIRMRAREGYNRCVREKWFLKLESTVQDQLVAVGWCPEFSLSLGKLLTGDLNFGQRLRGWIESGDFICRLGDGCLTFLPLYREFLIWEFHRDYSREMQRSFYERAIAWYELHGYPERALECYRMSENYEGMQRFVQRLCEQRTAVESGRAIGKYLDDIPVQTIRRSPVLMGAMSVRMSLSLRVQESEEWYAQLQSFAKARPQDSAAAESARHWLAFLDLELPHRDHGDFLEVMQRYAGRKVGRMRHPLSLSTGTPSLLSGAVDLSEACMELRMADEWEERKVRESAGVLLGEESDGTLELLRLESALERGEVQEYPFDARVNEQYIHFDMMGRTDLSYVCVVLLVRSLILQGSAPAAEQLLQGFLPRLDALQGQEMMRESARDELLWLRLLQGSPEHPDEELGRLPDAGGEFSFADRDRCLHRLRLLIAARRYQEACTLAGRLRAVFSQYHRPLLLIRTLTLEAVVLGRMGRKEWVDSLTEALALSRKYGYVLPIAQEGAAVRGLLERCSVRSLPEDFLLQVRHWTDHYAELYPLYLDSTQAQEIALTDKELAVLRLLCEGMSSSRICQALHITYSGLKYHKNNIYRKLSVSSRRDAERRAQSLGLVQS